ncbi:sperm-associated antigen 5 isoform X2 [Pygocentrus nattereri]|uniref:sperm-associated antigen 5 isoform X2 n=1 Tax=Pygocentrus nattereri TaxID=42514 RepID=UPI000814988F|nr:sperm-associated antigen 5 isoform X2 [Pygocentrus nattereri]
MAARGQQPLMRPDRAPLRDVQNEEKQKTAGVKAALLGHKNPAREVENVSPFSGPKADGTFITSISSNRSEEGAVGNVTLKSFLCAGGEVEISEGSEMSDESILVRALMLEDGPQTLNNTTVTYPDSNEAVLSNREHVDHPYCTHPSDEPSCANMMQDGKLNGADEVCSVNRAASLKNADISEVSSQEMKSSTNEQADITFKSFTCPGGEIEVADGLIMQDSIMLDDMPLEGPSQSFRDESEISEDHAKLLVSPCHHVDHPYCHYEVDSSASRGDDCICTSVENLDAVVSNAELDNLSSADTSMALSQLVEEPGDLTFRSLTFPGAEVEIENTHDMSVISMLMNNLTLDGYLQPFSCSFSEHDGENNAALTSNSEHADHLYCCVEDADVCGDGSTNPLVPDPIICESKAHSSSQLSSTGLLESSETAAQVMSSLGTDGSPSLKPRLALPISENSLVLEELIASIEKSDWSHNLLHHCENNLDSKVNSDVIHYQGDLDQQSTSNHEENKAKEDLTAMNGLLMHDHDHVDVLSEIGQFSSDNEDLFSDVGEHAKSYSSQANISTSVENSGRESVNVDAQIQPLSLQHHCSENEVESSKVLQCQENNQQCLPGNKENNASDDSPALSGILSEVGNIDNSAENFEAKSAQIQSSLLNCNEAKVESSKVLVPQDDIVHQTKPNEPKGDLTAIAGPFTHPSVEVQSDLSVSRSSSEKEANSPSKFSYPQANVSMLGQNTASSFNKRNFGIKAESRNVNDQSQHTSLLNSNKEDEVGDSSKGLQGQDNINQQTLSDNEEKNVLAQNVESYSQAAVGMSAGNFRAECGDVGAQNMPAQHNDVDLEASVVQDSALGLSGIHSGSEILRAESVHECHTDAMPLHTQLWSALTLCDPSTPRNAALGRSVLQGHVEGNLESRLWPELPESPIPPPQLNSTTLPQALTPLHPRKPREARIKAAMMPNEKAPVVDFSTMSKGPLQQQLRQMAELLILASGKIAAPSTPAPVQHHTAEMATTPVQHRSAAVWTTPVLTAERSVNTSAQVELVKETEVSDACTSTDSLLWSVSPSSLQSLSRPELEQKLLSTLIMVEVLSQQLSSAKSHTGGTGPAPSELRDRLVQTEHTQLSQMGPYKELYVSAVERIHVLEEDQDTLQSLYQAMQQTRNTMTAVKTDTEEALGSLKQIESIVNEDLEILCKQMSEVKALYGRCMGALKRMEEKCKACLQERDGMRRGMEEAVQEKETVLRVLEQLRAHHSAQVSDLQRSLGSQQELTTALTHTYPQLVELNRSYVESLSAASALLREKLDDDEHLSAELHKAHWLLQKTNPVLQKLQQRASAAVEQSQLFQTERDIAVEEKAQMEVELEQAHAGLQTAEQQIADLNTQITIMNSEMTVLREQLSEVEEERAQLQRKSTELSATVSSSLASYAFLEQALASETNKLQRSLHETQESIDRADGLQADLEVSQRRVEELEEVLAQRDTLLTELHEEAENQRLQLRRLTQIQAELSSAREMGDFLQAENELTREQLTESEGLLRSHLQGLRERNLECEDLRLTLQQLRVERSSLQEELDSTRDKARVMLLEQGEQLAQATLDVSLLQHRVRCLTSSTHAAATAKSTEAPGQDELQQQLQPPRQPCGSFVSSVMLALTEEPEADAAPDPAVCPAEEESTMEGIGSKSSAFTRLPPTALQHADENSQSTTLVELLASLGDSMSELQSAIEQLKQHKDSELNSLQSNIRGLQEALQVEFDRHRVEEAELRQQVGRLKAQAEKDTQVLQQKTQDEKALRKLCRELEENMEAAQKQRAENSELRREGAELRRALQQSQVEVQALRAELTQLSDQSTTSTKELDDRIRLLKEVEKLKAKLMEVEESRAKLLERAKRHQMVHAMNQSKLERELHLLDDMIETARKTLSTVPEVVKNCPELQKLVEFLG